MAVDAAAAVWDNAARQWLQRSALKYCLQQGENAAMGRPGDVTIYHNPRCSKSRATLQLLHERGIEPRVVDYLKAPPDAAELSRLLEMLHMKPRDLMRKHEAEYRQEALDDPGLTRETLIHAMTQHPRLIERPIVVANGKAALGRPPENVLEIL